MSEYYTITEAARILGLSRARVHQFVKTGRLRAEGRALGRYWYFTEHEIARFAALSRPSGRPRRAPVDEK